MGEEHYVAWFGIALSAISATIAATAFLSHKIDQKVSTEYYDLRHNRLIERVRELELWAAKQGYTNKD